MAVFCHGPVPESALAMFHNPEIQTEKTNSRCDAGLKVKNM